MKKKTLITCTILIVIAVIVLVGYKVYRRPATFRHLTDKSLDEQQVNELKNTILAKDDKKILVAYFSYSGTTKNVATTLSEKTGADLFEIAPKKEYSNVYAQSNREIRRGSRPELAENISNIDDYDIVFVGYPVWWHATPAPVNTFLESYDFNGKLIIPFCTSGESDIDETMPTFLDSCEGLAVYGEKRISGTREIDNWLQELGMANENSTAVEREVNYEYKTEELYANREGNQIYGVIYIPQSAGEQMPTVIFSHGFGGNYQVGTQYAKGLAAKGYVVYCFDFCGGSTGSRSDGSTLEMSIFTEQKDLEAVISMIQSLDCVDADNIFLMGTSQGGAVSAITAAAHKDEIKGAVLLYPAFCLVDMTKERFKSVEEIPDTYYSLWMTVGRAYAENLLDYDIYDAVSAYKKDVLILHGDADNIVPLSYSEKALEVYSSARLEVFPGAGHGFYGEDAERAIELMTEYLDSHRT